VRFRAARPPTFFVLPKKVGKERRAHEVGRCAAALRCSRAPVAIETRTISRLRREPRASDSRWPSAPAPAAPLGVFEGINVNGARRGEGFDASKGAEQRRASRSFRASTVRSTWLGAQRRDRASFDVRRLVRVAQGTAVGGVFAGAPFFGYFLWQDKESDGPRGPEARRGGGIAQRSRGRTAQLPAALNARPSQC
jgi:hypothetical protein